MIVVIVVVVVVTGDVVVIVVVVVGLNAVLMRRQSCVEAYAEDAQAPASSFGSEKEGSLSKA